MKGLERYTYFACDSGPHLVLPLAYAADWHGVPLDVDASNVLSASHDYGRACKVDGDVGLVEVGSGAALVLGGSPPMTAVRELDRNEGVDLFVLEEWHSKDLDSILDDVCRATRDASGFTEVFRWTVPPGGAGLLFAGDTIEESVYGVRPVPLGGAMYRAAVTTVDVDLGIVFVCRLAVIR